MFFHTLVVVPALSNVIKKIEKVKPFSVNVKSSMDSIYNSKNQKYQSFFRHHLNTHCFTDKL